MRLFKTEAKTSILVAVLLILVVASLRPGKEVSGDAALQQHSPILIDGNSAFTGANGVLRGAGTVSDPFFITNWQIDASTVGSGITVVNTTRYFTISSVDIFSASRGIYLKNVTNGMIELSNVRDSTVAILVDHSTNTLIVNNILVDTRSPKDTSPTYCNVTVGFVPPRCALAAVYSHNSKGISIVGNRVSAFLGSSNFPKDGIVADSSPGITISKNTVQYGANGIVLQNSGRSVISGNNASFNGVYGIDSTSDDVNITGNLVSQNHWGIITGTGFVRDNIVEANLGFGISWAGNGTLSGNKVSYNGGSGIEYYPFNAEVTSNIVTFNALGSAYSQDFGIADMCIVQGCPNSTKALVSYNQIAYNYAGGLGLGVGPMDTLVGNNFTGDGLKISLPGASTPFTSALPTFFADPSRLQIASDNSINGKPLLYYTKCTNLAINGIPLGELLVVNCRNLRISNLHIYESTLGIQLIDVNDTLITGNSVNSNTESGIRMDYYNNATIVGNNISNNGADGSVNGVSAASPFQPNTVGLLYHNNFIDDLASGLMQDNGYPSGGNYWWPAVVSAVDNCSGPNQDICPKPDGIADKGGTDRYPLMHPYLAMPDTSPPAWLPNQPMVVRDVGQDSATLLWLRAADDVGVVNYLVYRGDTLVANVSADSLMPIDLYVHVRADAAGKGLYYGYGYNITGLASGTTYTFKVIAVDLAGNRSPPSQAVTVTIAPTWQTQATWIIVSVVLAGLVTASILSLRWWMRRTHGHPIQTQKRDQPSSIVQRVISKIRGRLRQGKSN